MKRTFEIEWSDELTDEPEVDVESLLACLQGTDCYDAGFIRAVRDVTPLYQVITIDEHGVIHAPNDEARDAVLAAIRYAAEQR